jgi:hypothetical protein
MNAERKKVLEMLAGGKISAEEAEKLLETFENKTAQAASTTAMAETGLPKYLFVKVDSTSGDKVNIRVPMKLIQAGIQLKSLLPQDAREKINATLGEKGIHLDDFNPENLKDLLDALTELEVNVDDKKGDTVRIYCSNT